MTVENDSTNDQEKLIKEYENAKKAMETAGLLEPETVEEEPHVEIIGDSITEDGQIKIEMDWNESFINSLRNSGYTGADDDRVVQQWLIQVYEGIITDLSEGYNNEYE